MDGLRDQRVVLDLHERPPPVPDRAARERIRADLETNLLVEAGAGSGKTTELVGRMVALVRSGVATPGDIAGITFTRKAAAELRERFLTDLEEAATRESDPNVRERLRGALLQIDHAFIGTIHAFCARLLRERPIEAGLDPGFEEMLEAENARLMKSYWATFLERLVSDEDPALERLAELGLSVHRLEWAYYDVAENLDVTFPAEPVPAPGPEWAGPVRERLEALLDRGEELMPNSEPSGGWDPVQRRLKRILFQRRAEGWEELPALVDALQDLCETKRYRPVQKRWDPEGGRSPAAKRLGEDLTAFVAPDGPAQALLRQWYAHRYPAVIDIVRRAAEGFARYRLSTGRVSFQDLLIQAARLLRRSPGARRDLGKRYRHILVDEFQDTDPIQAEVVFLLASEPADSSEEPNWWDLVPRPGALFVVGDPKQSIYRFRRADIAIYTQVKDRFRTFGDVLTLTSNFRSRHDVARLVNDVFGEAALFPAQDSPYQARFAPLRAQRREVPVNEGVFVYSVSGSRVSEMTERDAELIADWVAGRVGGGERAPGDFLILTRTKTRLGAYARALEDRGLPVDVAGAGVGYQEMIRELVAILGAFLDPDNDLLVVQSLMGAFFGIDPDSLIAHRLSGGRWSFIRRPEEAGTAVQRALVRLHDWWAESRALPADVFIGRLVSELGLFPHAAASDLGSQRTGALVYALDAVRAMAVAGDASLLGAVEALEAALDWDDAEAPLEPGRSDAVRVMNLHKAKGLQAPVVVLAYPTGLPSTGQRTLNVERRPGARPQGWVAIEEVHSSRWTRKTTTLAAPADWERKRAREIRYEEAEEDRLLYVAVTRACDELVVARRESPSKRYPSPWHKLDAWLDEQAIPLDLDVGSSKRRESLERSAEEILAETRRVGKERAARGTPTYRFSSVTELAKGLERPEDEPPPPDPTPGEGRVEDGEGGESADGAPTRPAPRGYEWGSVVHSALATAARGLGADALREVCRSLLIEEQRPVDREGRPRELDELLALLERVRRSELWARAMASGRHFSEVPFAAERPGVSGEGVPETVEGVIDLVFREAEGWVVADYKTDVGDDPDFPRRERAYRRQVDLYAECWEALTGERVKERILLFTSQDRMERW